MSFFPSAAFLTGSVGTGEWIVLFVVILIVVGPKRLPEVARKIGRTMEMFRRAADEFKDQLMNMDQEPHTPSGSGEGSATPSENPDSYSDAYPNLADYPGNEDHVQNWANGEGGGSEGTSASQPAESAGGASVPPETTGNAGDAPAPQGTEKPAEGGA